VGGATSTVPADPHPRPLRASFARLDPARGGEKRRDEPGHDEIWITCARLRLFRARRVVADAGFGRQRAFAQNGQKALHRILSDHVRIGLTGLARLQRCHLGDRVVEVDMVRQQDVGVFLFENVAVFFGGVAIELNGS